MNRLFQHIYVYVYSFGSSNAGYMSWLVIGILGTEVMTGFVTDTLWTSLNYGKTYETVDWSKFKSADDDEEEEEEEGTFDHYYYWYNFKYEKVVFVCIDCSSNFFHFQYFDEAEAEEEDEEEEEEEEDEEE